MKEAQYWKPGEAKPAVGEANSSGAAAAPRVKIEGSRKSSKGKGDREERRGSSGEPKKLGKTGKGKEGRDRKAAEEESPSTSKGKPPAAGPSQTLLAMKFMQRKGKVDEAQRQQQDKRDKLERDFNSAYAKRLKADKANEKDRLICRADEQDPALVVVGRRSFGGFNSVAEAAYQACIREISAGARLGQPRGGADEGEEDGVSDLEMAERLGKNVRRGGR